MAVCWPVRVPWVGLLDRWPHVSLLDVGLLDGRVFDGRVLAC